MKLKSVVNRMRSDMEELVVLGDEYRAAVAASQKSTRLGFLKNFRLRNERPVNSAGQNPNTFNL